MISKYHKQPPLSSSKRLGTAVVDGIILIAVSFLIMLLTLDKIIPSFSSFKNEQDKVNENSQICLKMGEEAGLNVFNVNEKGEKVYDVNNVVSTDELFVIYAKKHILLAYEKDKDAFNDVDISKMSEYKEEKASFNNDIFATFFVSYVKKYNTFNGKVNDVINLRLPGYETPLSEEEYLSYILRKYEKTDSQYLSYKCWVDESLVEKGDFIYIRGEFAKNLYLYLSFADTTKLPYFNLLKVNFGDVYDFATSSLVNSSRYQEPLNNHLNAYKNCATSIDIGIIISYLISYLICICLPSFLLKDGQTLGLKLFKGAVVSTDDEEINTKQKILRLVVGIFTLFGTTIFSSYFAGSLMASGMFPIFSIGSLQVSLFHFMVILFILSIIGALIMAFSRTHKGFHELISNTIVVDLKDFSPNITVKDESNLETDAGKEISKDGDYFDSTSFNNTERGPSEK